MRPRVTFWRVVFAALVVAFLVITTLRFVVGLGLVTNLSDAFPWGIWIGFDILCRVGLAAGAFTLTAVVHIFNIRRFEPIVRPALLTGFLCYLFVIVALMFELGQPWRIWHTLVFWNPHSVLFEVAWCVMLYTTVLALEFSPVVFERLGFHRPRRLLKRFTIPLVLAGTILSTLHQSSLGSLFLVVPSKMHALWWTPLLPLLFYLSAIGAGLGLIIIESHLSGHAFGRRLDMSLLEPLGRAMAVMFALYGVLRLEILLRAGVLGGLARPGYEEVMFLVEFGLGVVLPVALLLVPRVRMSSGGLVAASILAVLGFVMNRLNVSVTALERSTGGRYFPSVMEVTVSVALVAIGFALFALAVRHLPIFPAPGEEEPVPA